MPNLKKYTQSIGTETSGSDFKPFVEASGSSPYPQGQCTWYVYQRMQQYDSSISGDLGDAHNWNNHAEREGYTVTHSPKTILLLSSKLANLVQIHNMVMLVSLKSQRRWFNSDFRI